MKTSSLATRLLLAVILLAVVVYFGVNIAASLEDPYTTTPTYAYTSEHTVTVSGYVVRDEKVLPDTGELVYFSRGEGERVSAYGDLALVCQDAQALESASKLHAAQEQLQQLLYAKSLTTGAQTAARLDSDVTAALVRFHEAKAGGDVHEMLSAAPALRSSVLKRSYAYSGTAELEAAIQEKKAEIQALREAIGPVSTAVRAPRSGLFSGLVDGYESVLTPEALETMTPEDYRSIAPAEAAAGLGKMIYGSRWSFVTLMRSEDAKDLEEGDSITLRFQTGLDRDLTMEVERMSREEGGQQVVVLTCHDFLQLTTLLRHQNAQLIFHSYHGLRVPRGAVRIVQVPMEDEEGQPLLDEAGNPRTEAAAGVYCLWGTTAKFKPVEVQWQEKEYLLVTPAPGVSGQKRLRAGDAVITASEDLYDGKVIK